MAYRYHRVITLQRLYHRGGERIALLIPDDEELTEICKSVGAKYSRSHSLFYVDNNPPNLKMLFEAFKGKAWLDGEEFFGKKKVSRKITREKIEIDLTDDSRRELGHFVRYLEARGMSESTIVSYRQAIQVFLTFYRDMDPADLTNDDINLFLSDHLYSQGYSKSYQSQFISAIKHFFRERFSKKVEIDQLIHPRKDKKLPKVFSKEEVASILKSTPNLKHKTVLSLQYGLGLRVGELVNLRLADFDFDRRTVVIFGKGRKARRVFLGKGLVDLVRNYLDAYKPDDWLFEGQYGRYSQVSVNKVLKASAKRAGIIRDVNSHMLRHSYATHLLESGVDLRYIQELLGHKNSKTTEIYTYVSTKKLGEIESPFDGLDL